ncbi:MAG: orotate phosphoribosyltransferase [Candidatus Kerfeldbacteria bacterium CG08_land_8_20_14_0_20_40_16]|uniref:Orotate phosphoribosyltransferase n=1 Tax=Candidatus Kerfeldbacteria bacterium CG08_land_8_20_14_0_20_40_16 TaxID=2014244 RepID=A0A2H0YYZ5_9BACT|nr:MAG: orotate phosphoribosyltransferase [Candidatus Kerfeldbacteria bacterium CG08_land_8_20_14_0_20_40_16]
MSDYKKEFIDFLVKSEALKFGEFTLKSGRKSPYFFSTGNFNTGASIYKLGYFYASKVAEEKIDFDVIFGPAYKGIPLAVSTAIALAKDFNRDKSYLFDRKEVKDYADKSAFVGYEPKEKEKVLLIDDVMTTGKTKEEAIEKIKAQFPKVVFSCLLIAFNRQEVDGEGNNAIEEFEQKFSIPVKAIVTVKEVIDYLHNQEIEGRVYLDNKTKSRLEDYLKKYGVS